MDVHESFGVVGTELVVLRIPVDLARLQVGHLRSIAGL